MIYLVRVPYDNQCAYSYDTLEEAMKAAMKWDKWQASIVECRDYYYGDNWQGWLPIGETGRMWVTEPNRYNKPMWVLFEEYENGEVDRFVV